jgi:hypothetical protein
MSGLPENLSPEDFQRLRAAVQVAQMAQEYRATHRREFVDEAYWYVWQKEFFATPAGQVMLLAGNRSGKTMCAGYQTALDLTGEYPDWWPGYRFQHAPNFMIAGVDNIQLKLVLQQELFGDVTTHPTTGKKMLSGNWVHQDEIGRITWNKVTADLAQSVEVWGKYGMAMCSLRSYSQSKTGHKSLSFAGTSLDGLWVDECPPDDLIGQFVVRTLTGNYNQGGRIRYTMTPELGKTQLVSKFMEDRGDNQALVGPISWDECPHLTPKAQAAALEGIPEHEWEMRKMGIPIFGEGLVFSNISERALRVDPVTEDGRRITDLPWLRYLRAIDIGINHPTAVVWLAFDAEIDCIYLLKSYAQKDQAAAIHASAANSYLDFAPCVFPHDVDHRDKGSGKTMRRYYADAGLTNTLDFKNPDGTIFVEPGIQELYDRMRSGRFKVLDIPENQLFFREMRQYHRENGKIVPIDDDVISAVRYGAIMIPRYGVTGGSQRTGYKPRVKKSFN